MTARPGAAPTPRDVAARLGLTDGSWTGENLEQLQALTEHMAAHGVTADEVAEAIRAAEPDVEPALTALTAPAEADVVHRGEQLRPSPVRRWIARGAQALDGADQAGDVTGRVAAQVRAGVCGVYALARGVGATAHGVHRVADALERIAAATEAQRQEAPGAR